MNNTLSHPGLPYSHPSYASHHTSHHNHTVHSSSQPVHNASQTSYCPSHQSSSDQSIASSSAYQLQNISGSLAHQNAVVGNMTLPVQLAHPNPNMYHSPSSVYVNPYMSVALSPTGHPVNPHIHPYVAPPPGFSAPPQMPLPPPPPAASITSGTTHHSTTEVGYSGADSYRATLPHNPSAMVPYNAGYAAQSQPYSYSYGVSSYK